MQEWKKALIAVAGTLVVVPTLVFVVAFIMLKMPESTSVVSQRMPGIAIIVFVAFMYMLPTYVASKKGHHNQQAIMWLNILAGWTGIGWLIALIWALTTNAPVIVVQTKDSQ